MGSIPILAFGQGDDWCVEPTGTPQNNLINIVQLGGAWYPPDLGFGAEGAFTQATWKVDVTCEVRRGGAHHAWLQVAGAGIEDNTDVVRMPTAIGNSGLRWECPGFNYFLANSCYVNVSWLSADVQSGDIVRFTFTGYQLIDPQGEPVKSNTPSVSYRELIITSCELPEHSIDVVCGTNGGECGWVVECIATNSPADHVVVEWGLMSDPEDYNSQYVEGANGFFVIGEGYTDPLGDFWITVTWLDAENNWVGDAVTETSGGCDICENSGGECEPMFQDEEGGAGLLWESGENNSSAEPGCAIDSGALTHLSDVVEGQVEYGVLMMHSEFELEGVTLEFEAQYSGGAYGGQVAEPVDLNFLDGSVIFAECAGNLGTGYCACVQIWFEVGPGMLHDTFCLVATADDGTGKTRVFTFCYQTEGDLGGGDPGGGDECCCGCCDELLPRLDAMLNKFNSLLGKTDNVVLKLDNITDELESVNATLHAMEEYLEQIRDGQEELHSVLVDIHDTMTDDSVLEEDYDEDGEPDYLDPTPRGGDVDPMTTPTLDVAELPTLPNDLIERGHLFSFLFPWPGQEPFLVTMSTLPPANYGYQIAFHNLRLLVRNFINLYVAFILAVRMYKELRT